MTQSYPRTCTGLVRWAKNPASNPPENLDVTDYPSHREITPFQAEKKNKYRSGIGCFTGSLNLKKRVSLWPVNTLQIAFSCIVQHPHLMGVSFGAFI